MTIRALELAVRYDDRNGEPQHVAKIRVGRLGTAAAQHFVRRRAEGDEALLDIPHCMSAAQPLRDCQPDGPAPLLRGAPLRLSEAIGTLK